MIYTFRYKGQTKPCICFDEIQALKVMDRLEAAGKVVKAIPFEASKQKVEQVKQSMPLILADSNLRITEVRV